MRRFAAAGLLVLAVLIAGCTSPTGTGTADDRGEGPVDTGQDNQDWRQNASGERKKATFAGGCFWCIEAQYDGLEGVYTAISGYAGGDASTATYDQVSTGETDHREAVQVTYDPSVVSYEELLERFWTSINPTDAGGQFTDRGPQYTTAIYAHDIAQYRAAMESKRMLMQSGRFDEPIATEIVNYTTFFRAEDYHQNYSQRNTAYYKTYERGSGRTGYVEDTWEEGGGFNMSPSDWRRTGTGSGSDETGGTDYSQQNYSDEIEQLSKLEYYVTQRNGTEPPYANELYDNEEPGIYVDVVSGEPLFSSKTKYKSGTGWPSFYKPLEPDNIVLREDPGVFGSRTEVASAGARSHLGHVFEDGPEPTGLRYCLNSAALEFIHASELGEEGYGEYTSLFNETELAD